MGDAEQRHAFMGGTYGGMAPEEYNNDAYFEDQFGAATGMVDLALGKPKAPLHQFLLGDF